MLKVIGFNGTQEEFEKTEEFKEMCIEADIYFKQVYDICLGLCKNDMQRTIFDDWWHGTNIYGERDEKTGNCEKGAKYIDCSEEDWYIAHSAMLTATSMGCG